MNAVAEKSIEFLCAFDCAPVVTFIWAGNTNDDLEAMYRRWLCVRVEAAINHLEGIPADLRAELHLIRLTELHYYVNAADFDASRRSEHLMNASMLLDKILAERGDR